MSWDRDAINTGHLQLGLGSGVHTHLRRELYTVQPFVMRQNMIVAANVEESHARCDTCTSTIAINNSVTHQCVLSIIELILSTVYYKMT